MKYIVIIFLLFSIPFQIFASSIFSSLLPNPAGDDTLGEYIEIRNTGCRDIDIAGYELRDLQRGYIFPSPSIIVSKSNLHLTYEVSRIALNNSGLETITLSNTGRNIVDTYSYSGTQRDNVVLSIIYTDDDCSAPRENSGSSSTGSLTDTGGSLSGSVVGGSGSTSTGGVDASFSESGSPGTGSLTDTGSILFSSGLTDSGMIADTGSISSSGVSSTGSTAIYSETGILAPIEMYYSDTDGNNKIDTLEISYPYELTGSVRGENISLYSESGGLSIGKIDTQTGYILSGFLSGNVLILSLREGDNEKGILRVNNTTSSDLRLKSLGDIGFRSIGGQSPESFLLTKSFDEYRKVYKKIVNNGELIIDNTGTGTNSGTGDSFGTGNTISATGSNSGTLNNSGGIGGVTHTGIIFPEIIPALQSPTNAIFSGEIFTCTTADCRINITLEPIFLSGFSMRDFSCSFGTGEILVVDSDCNPNTLYFSHSGELVIELVSKIDPTQKSRKMFPVEWKIAPIGGSIVSSQQNTGIPDMGKPIVIMDIDGKWKEYYSQTGDHELTCYTLTCSVNFTAENTYDPEGSILRFLWIYGQNDISTSKDPGGRKYTLGDHVVTLRAIDTSGNYSQIDYMIHVVGPRSKEEKIKEKEKKGEIRKKVEANISPKHKIFKKIKMIFFSPPEIILQGKSGEKKDDGTYVCQSKTKMNLCAINFSLTGTQRGYESAWLIDGKEVYRGKNPKSWKLSLGIHEIKILTYRKGSDIVSSEEKLTVRVLAQIKKAKKKKVAKVKVKKQKIKIPKIIPEAHAKGENPQNSSDTPNTGLLIFLSGSLLIGLVSKLRRRFRV